MLGNISKGGYQSLGNEFDMGSTHKVDGLFNSYSKYGSKYADTSSASQYAKHPPKIVYARGNDLIELGLVTINPYAQTRGVRIDPALLKAWATGKG
jgi:hypothetical protein